MFFQSRFLNRISIICSLFLVLLSQNGYAAIYKWKDEKGQIHYGSIPPRGVASQRMGVSTFTPPPQKTPAMATDAKNAATTPGKNGAADANLKNAGNKGPYTQQQHDTLCNNARRDMEALNKGGRLRVKQEDGSSAVMSDDDRAKRMKTMQAMIKKHCK